MWGFEPRPPGLPKESIWSRHGCHRGSRTRDQRIKIRCSTSELDSKVPIASAAIGTRPARGRRASLELDPVPLFAPIVDKRCSGRSPAQKSKNPDRITERGSEKPRDRRPAPVTQRAIEKVYQIPGMKLLPPGTAFSQATQIHSGKNHCPRALCTDKSRHTTWLHSGFWAKKSPEIHFPGFWNPLWVPISGKACAFP